MDLALNNLQGLICQKTKPNQSKPNSYRAIGLMSRVFVNGPGDRGSISGRILAKTQKMVLDTALLGTQQYKVGIKGKMKQS